MTRDGVRKPAYFAYKYLHALQGYSVRSVDPQSMLSTQDGNFAAVIWDFRQPVQNTSSRSFYTKIIPEQPVQPVQLEIRHLARAEEYRLRVFRTGFHSNDAHSAWLEVGTPKNLTSSQLANLNDLTRDLPVADSIVSSGARGTISVEIPMNSNDIVLAQLQFAGGAK